MGYLQGIFHEYGVTIDDHVTATRTGGFGSTQNKNSNGLTRMKNVKGGHYAFTV